MRRFFIHLVCLLLFAFLVLHVHAEYIHINEVAIDRSPQAVELINTATISADLSNWYIDDSGGTTYYTIPTGTLLYPQSCAVFEGDFNLNKSTPDTIRLFNAAAPPTSTAAVLVDSYSYNKSPGTGFSYARNTDTGSDWTTLPISLGSYNQTGLSCVITPTLLPTPSSLPTEVISQTATTSATPAPSATPRVDYRNIYINEVYPNPIAGGREWVELYNDNGTEVNLTDWYVDDVENGGGTPRRFSTVIAAHAYAVIEISGSFFNNDTDSVRLLNQDKMQVDGFEYGRTQQDKSLGRISFATENVCLEEPSKGNPNTACLEVSPTPRLTVQPTAAIILQSPPIIINKLPLTKDSYQPPPPNSQSLPAILGETTIAPPVNQPTKPTPVPVRKLASISLSYSILTIVSLLIKIKNGLMA